LEEATISRLLAAARDASFFTWAAGDRHCEVLDAPRTVLMIHDSTEQKVASGEACTRVPALDFFWRLAQAIDDAVYVERWIGTAAERAPLVADSDNERHREVREKFDWNKPASTCPP
jgi:hypothetical protein